MAAEFVSLADWLTGSAVAFVPPSSMLAEEVPAEEAPVEEALVTELPAAEVPADETSSAHTADALRDARLFRARLADAFDAAAARLLRELASDVLARELRLAPCDLAALVRRALERAPVVRVRVAPGDLARGGNLPVIADRALSAGDAVLELAGGALDARLGVRLAAVLEAFA